MLIPLIALYPIDFIYSQVAIKSNNSNIEAWYDLMHSKITADIVIMGNSRANNHIDPLILDSILCVNTYNLGMTGSPIDRQVKRYNLFVKYNKRPKLIIQNIDFLTLTYKTGTEKNQFLPYFWNHSMRNEFYRSEPFSFWEKSLPLYRYKGYGLFLQSEPRSLTKGYVTHSDNTWNGILFNEEDSISFKHNDAYARIFDDYLADVRYEGIKVVFVYAPIFIEATNKMTNLDEMYATYKWYADKYDIPVLDYTYMQICYDTTYFSNISHLNNLGAEIFTDSLANDIKKLGILNE